MFEQIKCHDETNNELVDYSLQTEVHTASSDLSNTPPGTNHTLYVNNVNMMSLHQFCDLSHL